MGQDASRLKNQAAIFGEHALNFDVTTRVSLGTRVFIQYIIYIYIYTLHIAPRKGNLGWSKKNDNAFDSMALPVFASVHYIVRDNRNAIAANRVHWGKSLIQGEP